MISGKYREPEPRVVNGVDMRGGKKYGQKECMVSSTPESYIKRVR